MQQPQRMLRFVCLVVAFGNIGLQFITVRRYELVTRAPIIFMLVLALVEPRLAGADQSNHDSEKWEGFIDGILGAQRQSHHYAGAVVVIVEDGRVAFERATVSRILPSANRSIPSGRCF